MGKPLTMPAVILTAASALLWGAAAASLWEPAPAAAMRVGVGAAVAASVIAALLWLGRALIGRVDSEQARRIRRDEHDDVYIRTIAALTRPAARRGTGPLRLVP